MPLNKNFQKRITILDECFSSPTGQFTLEKLIEVIGDKLDMSISRKTIQNDISYIKETIENKNSARIDFDNFPVFITKLFVGREKVFKYSSPDFALGNQLLSKTDQVQHVQQLDL